MSLVNVTSAAVGKLALLLEKEKQQKPDTEALRIAVIGGGCSGLKYKLGWDTIKEEDFVEEVQPGVKVVIDEKSAPYLSGATLNYKDSLMEAGFEIQNPNAKSSCGCGQSFS